MCYNLHHIRSIPFLPFCSTAPPHIASNHFISNILQQPHISLMLTVFSVLVSLFLIILLNIRPWLHTISFNITRNPNSRKNIFYGSTPLLELTMYSIQTQPSSIFSWSRFLYLFLIWSSPDQVLSSLQDIIQILYFLRHKKLNFNLAFAFDFILLFIY